MTLAAAASHPRGTAPSKTPWSPQTNTPPEAHLWQDKKKGIFLSCLYFILPKWLNLNFVIWKKKKVSSFLMHQFLKTVKEILQFHFILFSKLVCPKKLTCSVAMDTNTKSVINAGLFDYIISITRVSFNHCILIAV